jgi:hypothetical protein
MGDGRGKVEQASPGDMLKGISDAV